MADKNKDTIKINSKVIAVIVILLLLLFGTFGMFILKSSPNNTGSVSAQSDSISGDIEIPSNLVTLQSGISNRHSRTMGNIINGNVYIPEKCRLPAGQDVEAWKEHLGHHEETKECLKYFK